MIANITKGADFGGLCRYLLHPSKTAQIIGGNLGGKTPPELEAEFLAFANLNQRVRKPVNHLSLGFAPEDGEVDPTRQEQIANRIVTEMGYGNAQYLIVVHGRNDLGHDAEHEHDHIHIVTNSVDFAGKWVDDFQSFRRLEHILRQIEKDEGLRQIESSWEVKRSAPTHGQIQRFKREVRQMTAGAGNTVTLPVSYRLQIAIDEAATDSETVVEFAKILAQQGISTKFKVTRTGKVQGISYEMEGVKFQGNQLYDASLPKLQSARRLSFESVTDPKTIAAIKINPNPISSLKIDPAIEIQSFPLDIVEVTPIPVERFSTATASPAIKATSLNRNPITDGNPLNHIRKALAMTLENEPKPTPTPTSTVTPIPPDPEPTHSTEIVAEIERQQRLDREAAEQKAPQKPTAQASPQKRRDRGGFEM